MIRSGPLAGGPRAQAKVRRLRARAAFFDQGAHDVSDTAMSQASYLTPAAHERLQAELERLSGPGRVEIAKRIEAAREEGDLRENGGYHAAKEEQGLIAARMNYLEDRIARAEVIDISRLSGDRVVFGAKVTIENPETGEVSTYRIVGDDESSIDEGTISISSPIARALIGKEAGEETVIRTPSGARTVEIVEVEF